MSFWLGESGGGGGLDLRLRLRALSWWVGESEVDCCWLLVVFGCVCIWLCFGCGCWLCLVGVVGFSWRCLDWFGLVWVNFIN